MSAIEEPREKTLIELVEQLPPEMQREVRDFAEFLAAKKRREHVSAGEPSLSWAGALRELREQYTSVELQHAASDWMAEAD